MQKILRRTAQAKSQSKRKERLLEDKKHRAEVTRYKRERPNYYRQIGDAVRAEKTRRREHWELGPLSPYIGSNAERLHAQGFGAWDARIMNPPKRPERDRPKHWLIREGDRVCIVKGHESVRGRVGKVTDVNKENCTVKVEGLGRVDIKNSPIIREESKSNTQKAELPIPYSDIRLVYPLPDPITLVPRDCMMTNLVVKNLHFDRFENEETFERWLEPQHIRIPWPKKEEPIYRDEPNDTLRIKTDEQTFLPTLLRPPMPMGVIDELRNKYSKMRDRHDPEWVEQKMAEDEAAERETQRMWDMMPRGARNLARHGTGRGPISGMTQEKPAKPKGELSDELAEKIGRHMREKRLALAEEQHTS